MHQIQLDYLVLYLISSFVWYTQYMCIYRSNGIEKLFSFFRMIQLIWRERIYFIHSVGSVFFPLFLSFLFVEMHYQDEKESSVWIRLEISIRISPEYKHAPNRKESSSFLFGFAFYFFCVPLRKNLWQIFTLFEKVLQYQRNRSQNATVHNLRSCLCNKVIPSKDIQFGSRISIQFFLPTIPFNIFASKREPLALRSISIVYLT